MKKLLVTTGAAALIAAGCDGAPTRGLNPGQGSNSGTPPIAVTSSGITATAQANLTTAIAGLLEGREVLEGSQILDDLQLDISDRAKAPCVEPAPGNGDRAGGPCAEETLSEEAARHAEEIVADWFNEADVEAQTETSVTYLINAQRVCERESATTPTRGGTTEPGQGNEPGPDTGPDNPPDGGDMMPPPPDGFRPPVDDPPEVALDQECVDALAANPIRLVVTSRSEGSLDVAMQVGQATAGRLDLDASEASATLDLGQLAASFSALAGLVGANPFAPDVLEGAIRVAVERESADRFTASLAVTRAIRIEETEDEQQYSLRLGASNPTLAATIEGARRISSTVNLGSLEIDSPAGVLNGVFGDDCPGEAPARRPGGGTGTDGGAGAPPPPNDPPEPPTDCGEPELTGRLAFRLPGLSGSTTIDSQSDAITVSNVSLGNETTRLTVDGQQIFAFDLNATHRRSVDMTSARHADGIQASFAPALEARAQIAFGLIANSATELPGWMMDEDFRVNFDGAPEPTIVLLTGASDSPSTTTDPDPGHNGGGNGTRPVPPPPEPENRSIARVEAGTLELSSKHGATIRVPTGQCLQLEDDSTSGGGPTNPTTPVPPPTGGGNARGDHPFDALDSGNCE